MRYGHDLDTLEYPRHLHKPAGEYLHVDTAQQAREALEDGWSVEVPPEPTADAEPAAAESAPTPPTRKRK